MKRLFTMLSLVLCVSMLMMGVSAANVVDDAYEIYLKGAKKMSGVKSVDMYYTQKIAMSAVGGAMSMSATFSAKERLDSNGKLQMSITPIAGSEESIAALSAEQEIYYKNGYLYVNVNDRGLKYKADQSSAPGYFSEVLWDIKREDFLDASIERMSSGRRLRFKASTEKINEIKRELEPLQEYMDDEDMQIEISDASYMLTFNSSYELVSYSSTVTIKMVMEGERMTIKSTTSGHITSLNSSTGINFPADLADYAEVATRGPSIGAMFYALPA